MGGCMNKEKYGPHRGIEPVTPRDGPALSFNDIAGSDNHRHPGSVTQKALRSQNPATVDTLVAPVPFKPSGFDCVVGAGQDGDSIPYSRDSQRLLPGDLDGLPPAHLPPTHPAGPSSSALISGRNDPAGGSGRGLTPGPASSTFPEPMPSTRTTSRSANFARASARLPVNDAGTEKELEKLLAASKKGDFEEMERLLKNGVLPNTAVASTGRTPLHEAAEMGRVDMIRVLVDHGAFLDVRDEMGCCTPLYLAVAHKNHEAADCLLKSGAKVDASNGLGSTPLMRASSNGDIEMVKLLLESRPDLEIGDMDSWTALHHACYGEHKTLAELLVGAGASIKALTEKGETPLKLVPGEEHRPMSVGSWTSLLTDGH